MGDEGQVTGRCYYRKQRFFAVSRGKVNTVNPLLPRIIINFMLQRWNSIKGRPTAARPLEQLLVPRLLQLQCGNL